MKPASKSPEPPVASPGLPLATTCAGPRRSAITVGTPFNTTVPFTRCAALAAAAQRSLAAAAKAARSEEHTSELQSQSNLVCRLLLEKKKKNFRQKRILNIIYTLIFDNDV